MDIKKLDTSGIRRYKDGGYIIELPSFVGYCESVFYHYDGNLIDYQFSQGGMIDTHDLSPDTELGILMSTVFGQHAVRILDFDHPYKNHLIFLKHGKISSFQIRGKSYFILFYTKIDETVGYFTNFEQNNIFLVGFENHTFTIYNRSLGNILFQEHFESTEESLEKTIELIASEKEGKIGIMYDVILGEKELSSIFGFIEGINASYITQRQEGIILELSSVYQSELYKLGGILGSHQVIFDTPIYPNFLSVKELGDMELEHVSDFTLSTDILSFDHGWYTLRKNLLEIEYIRYILGENKKLLSGAISEMNILGSAHFDFQKKRSIFTLQDIEKMELSYEKVCSTLISLGKILFHKFYFDL